MVLRCLDGLRLVDRWVARAEGVILLGSFMALLCGGVSLFLSHLSMSPVTPVILASFGGTGLLVAWIRQGDSRQRWVFGGMMLLFTAFFLCLSSGVDYLVRLMTLLIALTGASLAVRQRSHVAIEVATRFVPSKCRRWIECLANVGAGVILMGLFPHAWRYSADAFEQEEVLFHLGFDGIPMPAVLGKGLLALALVVMSGRFFVLAFELIIDPSSHENRREQNADQEME